MAAEPEVLITWLLQKIETSFQSHNVVTACIRFDRQRRHYRQPNIQDGGKDWKW